MITTTKEKIERIKKVIADRLKPPSARLPDSQEDFKRKSDTLMTKVKEHCQTSNFDPEDFVNEVSPQNRGWHVHLDELMGAYRKTLNYYNDMNNEALLLAEIDKQAYRRALFYRIITTLGIGFSIMGIYWVAQCLDISMPLMRPPII
jgi:hypothetical protein